ncbi:GGDEF domain-containing protein [Bosea sp. (in: a-proteobacteria)]|uniref:GGDEF domain-containing protein n=1 Tax=Bosea sp. (in: a-proteobacteria) TaxID=1871050 RepID=UPI002FCB5A6C
MYQEVHTHNIVERAYAPEVADLLRRFDRSAQAASGGALFEDFSAELLSFCSRDIMIMAPTGTGDYVYEHFGRDIARHVGGDRTGERVSNMPPQTARFTIACYDGALASGKPLYSIHRAVKTVRVSLWERLVLPTTSADGQRRLIVFSKPLHFHEELLTTVLDTSPAGIVALRAVRDVEGNIERTVIITANRRAAAMAGAPEGTLIDAEGRQALPFLADDTVWRRCLYVMELRRGDMFETRHAVDGREVWLQIALAPLGDGLVMTLTDISELMLANLTLQSRAATLALEIGKERATRRALSHEIGQREEREQELRRLAEIDPLTTLLNRRSLIEKANAEIAAGEARGEETSLFIIDLDHFKQVNDNHGHAAGDAVIRAFADLLLSQMRLGQDLVGRLGGEEFAVVLPRTGAREAQRIAERLREALHRTHLPVSEALDLQVTASIGVATRQPGEGFAAFVARADKELYRAKNEGRDCIRCAEGDIAAAA